MGSIDFIKLLSTVQSSAVNKSLHQQEIKFLGTLSIKPGAAGRDASMLPLCFAQGSWGYSVRQSDFLFHGVKFQIVATDEDSSDSFGKNRKMTRKIVPVSVIRAGILHKIDNP